MHFILFRDRLEDASGRVVRRWPAPKDEDEFVKQANAAVRKARGLTYLYLADPLTHLNLNPALRQIPPGEGLPTWQAELAMTYPGIPSDDITAVHYPLTEGVIIQGYRKSSLQRILAGRTNVYVVPLPLYLAHRVKAGTEPPALGMLVRERYLTAAMRPWDDVESVVTLAGNPIGKEDVERETLNVLQPNTPGRVYFFQPGSKYELAGFEIAELPLFDSPPPDTLVLPDALRPPLVPRGTLIGAAVVSVLAVTLLLLAPGYFQNRLDALRARNQALSREVQKKQAQAQLLQRIQARIGQLQKELARVRSGDQLAQKITRLAQAIAPLRAGITTARFDQHGATLTVETADLGAAQSVVAALEQAFAKPRISAMRKQGSGFVLELYLPFSWEVAQHGR